MRYKCIVLLLCGLTAAAGAQPQRFQFEHITAENGLPDNLIWAVYQDRLGFMWFASGSYLVKYDGYDMITYDLGPTITRFHEDGSGTMWMASLGGLIRFDRDQEVFRSFRHAPNDSSTISAGLVLSMHEDRQGYLWLITAPLGFDEHPEQTYLNRFDPRTESVTRFHHHPDEPASFSAGRIPDNRYTVAEPFRFAFHEDGDGVIWIGSDTDGLSRYDPELEGFVHYQHDALDPLSISSNHVTAIAHDYSGDLWVGTQSDGLNLLDRRTGRFLRYRHEIQDASTLCDDNIHAIHVDSRGVPWVTTRSGICRYDSSTGSFRSYDHNPEDDATPGPGPVYVAAEDDNGNLWMISDYSREIDFYDRASDRFIRYPQNLDIVGGLRRLGGIFSVVLDRSGELWVGTWEGGVNKLSPSVQKFRVLRHDPLDPESLSGDYVTGIEEGSDGQIWIGTSEGLNSMRWPQGTIGSGEQAGAVVRYRHDPNDPTSLSLDYVSDVLQSHSGEIWIGTEGGGLNRLNRSRQSFVRFVHDPANPSSLSNNNVTSLVEDAAGTLWVGTRGGLNRFNPSTGEFGRYNKADGDSTSLCTDEIHNLYVDRSGALWVGGNLGGVCRLDTESGKFSRYFLHHRFETVISLFEDSAGRFWVGTHGHGLHRLDPADGTFAQYTERDGLAHDKVKAIAEDRQGFLWIGTERGLSRFDPAVESFRNYSLEDGLPSHFFTWPEAAGMASTGQLLFGTDHGLLVFDPERVKQADNQHPPMVALTGLRIFNQPVTLGENSPLTKHINTAEAVTLRYAQNDISIDYAALHYSNPESNRYAFKLDGYEQAWRHVGGRRSATYTSLDPGDYVFRVKAANSDGVWNEVGASLQITVLPPFWMTWWFRSLLILSVLLVAFAAYRKRINTLEQKRRELEERVKERTEAAEALERALMEVESLKNRLEAENTYLQREITLQHNFEEIVTCSDVLKQILHRVEQVAATEATVLILGETGTGKELLARAIHSISPRGNRPLVKVNCAALPSELIESELFGHEKGAFTGAVARKIGRFELANGGTIFLDEIGDLPLELQAKLLRILQEGEFERLGGTSTIRVDVRVIAATNRDLEREKGDGSFREDLFYRLSVFPITSPPLRERTEDIPLLVKHFVDKYSKKTGKRIDAVPESVITTLQAYHWPGNVRELENVIERSVILSQSPKLVLGEVLGGKPDTSDGAAFLSLHEMERQHILKALDMCNGQVFGEKGAARILDMNPQTLTSRMKRLGIPRKRSTL